MKSFVTRSVLVLVAVFCAVAVQAEDFTPLPFPVKIGGHSPKVDDVKKIGVVAEAVASDAELEVTVKDNAMVICNIVAANEKGDVKEGAIPAILIIQKSSKTALNKTMDNKALAAGTYRINIVADGKTAIVNFTVK